MKPLIYLLIPIPEDTIVSKQGTSFRLLQLIDWRGLFSCDRNSNGSLKCRVNQLKYIAFLPTSKNRKHSMDILFLLVHSHPLFLDNS